MSPVLRTTVKKLSYICHGQALPFKSVQASMFLPSNKTIASDGGILLTTGVIFLGSGYQTSVAFGSVICEKSVA